MDVVELSTDDEDEKQTPQNTINKKRCLPMVELRFSDGQQVKREANIITDLLQQRYIDFFVIDPLMRTVINGSKFELGYVDSQAFAGWQNLVKKYKLDRIHDPTTARQFLRDNPAVAVDFRKNPRTKDFACDISKPYTAIVVFLPDGKHWYLIVVSQYAQWLHKGIIDSFDIETPFVYVFDPLLQDIEHRAGRNYRLLPHFHDLEIERTLFPIMRFAGLIFKNNPGLFKKKLFSKAVHEVFGQGTAFDCGAFVLIYAEKIANGELIETQASHTWQWKDGKDEYWISCDREKMHISDMLFYRALCYQRAKDMVINGEILEMAEERLTNGESAFEGDAKFELRQGLINRANLARIGFKAKTRFPTSLPHNTKARCMAKKVLN